MKTTIAEFVLRSVADASQLAHRARVLAAMAQLSPQRRNELAEAVDMVCRTIAAHGGKGTVRFSLVQQEGQRAIEVSITDLPPSPEAADQSTARRDPSESPDRRRGAPNHPEAVLQRVGELVDHFESSGWPVAGAVIRLAQTLPPAFAFPSESEFADWTQILQSNTALDALAYALHRARTLERDLGHAQCQQQLRTTLGTALTESDHLAMLSLVIGKTKNAISILQPDGTIVGINSAFEQMTLYTMKDAIGRRRHELLYGQETNPAALRAFHTAPAPEKN